MTDTDRPVVDIPTVLTLINAYLSDDSNDWYSALDAYGRVVSKHELIVMSRDALDLIVTQKAAS